MGADAEQVTGAVVEHDVSPRRDPVAGARLDRLDVKGADTLDAERRGVKVRLQGIRDVCHHGAVSTASPRYRMIPSMTPILAVSLADES